MYICILHITYVHANNVRVEQLHIKPQKYYGPESHCTNPCLLLSDLAIVTGSAKRGLIADPNRTYLESHNLTCEFSTTLVLICL